MSDISGRLRQLHQRCRKTRNAPQSKKRGDQKSVSDLVHEGFGIVFSTTPPAHPENIELVNSEFYYKPD
jgi:hypothetical protein